MPVLLGALAAGCVERKERIAVAADGTVTIELEYKGDANDLNGPDAMPSAKSGWSVERSFEKKKKNDGKEQEEQTWTAKRSFSPGQDLPSTFAAKDDPQADLALSFPTSVRLERRKDGTYVHFRRVYQPRKWAYVNVWQEEIMDEKIKKLAEKPAEEMDRSERLELLQAFGKLEAFKQIEFVRAALNESDPGLAQDHWLKVREAALSIYRDYDYDSLVGRLEQVSKEEHDERIEAESKRLLERAEAAVLGTLRRSADYNDENIAKYEMALGRARKLFAITDQHNGHLFHISVNMPGEIVGHNADKLEDDDTAVWEFGGNAFQDRAHELLITSRIRNESDE